ncbi:MBL fold metallo-hydrolase [Promicromonospora aerolata]|uniref:MBL fold metallo-hydrolase n=1 Tax=Promicromonospora aerolata TaxID=195749 RepID=A0ABW4V4N0_9MICO
MSVASTASEKFHARVISGPTVVIEYGGLRLLTDPGFDRAGTYPGARPLVRTADSPVTADEVGTVDAVLLSHDEHFDNLDNAGRAFLAEVPLTLTTLSGAGRLGGTARGLAPWETVDLPRPGGGSITVTATRAQHGPDGSEPVVGDVIGFVLTGDDLPVVYVSGDNASLDVVREVADRFDVEEAVLFAGAVCMPVIRDEPDLLTLDAERAVEATRMLDARRVLIAHVDSWAHFSQDLPTTVAAFDEAGLGDRLARR